MTLLTLQHGLGVEYIKLMPVISCVHFSQLFFLVLHFAAKGNFGSSLALVVHETTLK